MDRFHGHLLTWTVQGCPGPRGYHWTPRPSSILQDRSRIVDPSEATRGMGVFTHRGATAESSHLRESEPKGFCKKTETPSGDQDLPTDGFGTPP